MFRMNNSGQLFYTGARTTPVIEAMDANLEPTIIIDQADQGNSLIETDLSPRATEQSRIRVASQTSSSDRLTDLFNESTRRLLRERLIMAMGVIASLMLIAQVLNFIMGMASTATLTSRMAAATVLIGSTVYLWSRPTVELAILRWLEAVVVVVPLAEVLLVQHLETRRLIDQGKASQFPTLAAALGSVFVLFIATYAMFIPSNWRRTAVVAFAYAIVATAMTNVQFATIPELAEVEYPRFTTSFVLFATAIIATVAAHFVRSIRQEVESARQYGQYHLTEEIGRGAMGIVYRADHRMLKRPAAIKLIRSERASDDNAIARFEQEVQLSATLSHWNTVQIYDYGRTANGDFYYVMEHLNGRTLAEILKNDGPMETKQAINVVRQVCDGLAEAHKKTLVHRDLKPANIFLTDCGSQSDIVKILDFGLATSQSHPLHDRSISGSPAYMSPEQIRGEEVDGRSDIYSLGCVLYECLTAKPLFSGASISDVFDKHLSSPPPVEPSPALTDSLTAIIQKCVAKSADDRYADVISLREALDECKIHQLTV